MQREVKVVLILNHWFKEGHTLKLLIKAMSPLFTGDDTIGAILFKDDFFKRHIEGE